MRKTNLFYRVISLVLVFALVVPGNAGAVFAAPAGDTSATPGEVPDSSEDIYAHSGSTPLAGNNIPDGMNLQLQWDDSTFRDGDSFNLVEERPVENAVRLKVSYSCAEIREEGYKAGELIISVKGIGNVGRDGLIEATVGADKSSSGQKTRDWFYTWNKANDTYTFTNNEAIPGNNVFSGYFELVWTVDARQSVHGYSQSDIKAVLYLPDGDSITANTLSFSNRTKADAFEVYIEQGAMYSAEGLTAGISKPDDYAYIRYNLGAADFENARGLKSDYFLFDPDAAGIGAGAIVISPALKAENMGDGTYRVSISSDPEIEMDEQYIFVAYPKNAYSNKTITASITKYGAYYEGDDAGNTGTVQLAVDTLDVNIPNNFDFSDIPGDIYQFYKDTYYDKYVRPEVSQAQGGDIAGKKMTMGTEQTFYLEGPLNNPDGIRYTLEVVDDFVFIRKNNAEYRQLEPGEYSFTSVTIPGTSSLVNTNGIPIRSGVYPVSVYISTNGAVIDPKTGTPVWSGYITESSQLVDLTRFSDNITAISIVMFDLAESVANWQIPVTVNFHTKDTSGLAQGEQDNLTSGEVVNTTFIRVYAQSVTGTYSWKGHDGSYFWINDKFTEANYLDYAELGLAAKDIATYGCYLDRERDNITFFEAPKNDYRAYTQISPLNMVGSKLVTTFRMGADFTFKDDVYPNKFSLYTILDEKLSLLGYKYPEDIWDIMTLSSFELSEEELAAACTPEIITDYKGSGRTYIALHFDFGDTQVPQTDQIWAAFNVKANVEDLKESSVVSIRSVVAIDKEIAESPLYKLADAGAWGDDAALWSDIDRDGDIEELLAGNFDSTTYVYADSAQLQLTKYVQTTYSDDWVQLPDVPSESYGSVYQYALCLRTGKSLATNIIVKDILETGANAQWQGTFQSVDLSQCDIPGTVYYSTKTAPAESLASSDWSTTKPNNVKAIAVDFGSAVLQEGQTLKIIINMKAPSDASLRDKTTENGFCASFTMMDAATGNATGSTTLNSNFVRVKLTPALKSIVITKEDAETGEKLKGATFALYRIGPDGQPTGPLIAEATSNAKGYAVFHNVPADASYILRETAAPEGYRPVEDVRIDMNGNDQQLVIKDPRLTGTIHIRKVNNLDSSIPVAGATYTLYDESGKAVKTAVTGSDGLAVFDSLPWGSYTVKETAAPSGYRLNETEYTVEIGRGNVSKVQVIDAVDVQADVSVTLTKYAALVNGTETRIPLAGATFELFRKVGEKEHSVGLYVTDSEGRIEVIELPYGEYFFREYRAPAGYQTGEEVSFALSPNNKDVSVTVYNQRKPGSVMIVKKDNLGNLLNGIGFAIYAKDEATGKPAAAPFATVETDEYGIAVFEGLEWGTYYIQETDAPDWYRVDPELKEIEIGAKSLEVSLEIINQTVRGAVILTKTDEDGSNRLPGAEYTLYRNDGTVVGVYTTADSETSVNGVVLTKGQFLVSDLEWGTYYFKETKAPDGYCLSDETVRFSVNAQNAGMIQYLEAVDILDAKTITLTKKILASDINFANGVPSFLFKVEGTDINGQAHTYFRAVTFTEEYVNDCLANELDEDGYVSLQVSIGGLTAGTYVATELDTSRYCLEEITDAVNGVISGDKVTFDLVDRDAAVGSAVFTNRNYEQQDFSDAQIVTNVLKRQRKLTALKVTYGATTAKAEDPINTDILEVIAIYDDGTVSGPLSKNDYVLSANGEQITSFPNQNGDYTVTVSYTDNGITRRGNFTVTLSGMKVRVIRLEASLLVDPTVKVGTSLTTDMFAVTAIYNTGDRKTLAGNEFTVNPGTVTNSGPFTVTISLNLNAIPNDGYPVSTTVSMTGKHGAVLESGPEFYMHIPENATAIVFTDVGAPSGVATTDVSADKNGSVVGWLDGTTFYVSARNSGEKIAANENCEAMFYSIGVSEISFNGVLDTSAAVNMGYMFARCTNLTSLDLSSFDTSNVTIMYCMFQGCSSLEGISFGNDWSTANVYDMYMMFANCRVLAALDVSEWDVSSLVDATGLFEYCYALTALDVSKWDVSKVTSMTAMFQYCSNLSALDLSGWNAVSVEKLQNMFWGCQSLTVLDLTGFDTHNVTITDRMFYSCSNLTTIYVSDGWYVPPSDTDWMFQGCTSLVGGAGTAYNQNYMCANYAIIDGGSTNPGYLTGISMTYDVVGISKTASPTVIMQGIFQDYTIVGYEIVSGSQFLKVDPFTGVVTGLAEGEAVVKMTAKNGAGRVIITQRTVYVGRTAYAVYSADDQSLTFYKTSDTIKPGQSYMGKTATAVYTGIETTDYIWDDVNGLYSTPWSAGYNGENILKVVFADEIKPISMVGWFCNFNSMTSIDLGGLDTSNVRNMTALFKYCYALKDITWGGKWSTANVEDMSYMFYACEGLTNLDLSSFDTSNVENMESMFSRCESLSKVNLTSFDTSKVINMGYLFSNSAKLEQLDLSTWNTENVMNMSRMFNYCSGLTTVYVSDSWTTENVTSSKNMFSGCASIVGGKDTMLDSSYVDCTYARIDGGASAPGYFTDAAEKP